MKKPPTKAESEWMSAIQATGCIVCRENGFPGTPACIHHELIGGKRRGHFYTLPLCPYHHTECQIFGGALHNGKKTFLAKYGSEEELREKVRIILGE